MHVNFLIWAFCGAPVHPLLKQAMFVFLAPPFKLTWLSLKEQLDGFFFFATARAEYLRSH